MALELTLALPRFIVLKTNEEREEYEENVPEFLTFNKNNWYLEFSSTQAVDSRAKFEVEVADEGGKDGLVHIRSSRNNKYWERTKNLSITGNPAEQYWITATAEKEEEDQSKESCTLFKFISVDSAANTFRIIHVQSGCYLCLWPLDDKTFSRCILANYKVFDGNSPDIFTIIDWESLLILPKFVAFKGDNDQYLCLRQIDGHPYLQFATDDIGDKTVTMQPIYNNEGLVRFQPINTVKFCRRNPDSISADNWIWADIFDTSDDNKDVLFRPVKVDDKTVALLNLGNNYFCRRLTIDPITDCLNATAPSTTKEAQLRVEEPVTQRTIYSFNYDLDGSRIYDETVHILAANSASNNSQQSITTDVKLFYTNTITSTWTTNISLKLAAKAIVDVDLPLIVNGNIELSGEIQSGIEWDETKTTTTVVEVVQKVVVPPMTKVTVYLVATKGKCDVPFSYMQRDIINSGLIAVIQTPGGTYIGSNYYNTYFETKEEPLSS